MSPEQFTGTSEVGPPSDIYSLGCVVYEMLTGFAPFAGHDVDTLRTRHCTGEVRPVRAHRREVPLAVDLAVRRALAKQPPERFARADEFGAALRSPRLDAAGLTRALWPKLRPWAAGGALVVVVATALLVAKWPSRGVAPSGLRVAVLGFTPAFPALRADAERLADELTENLSRIQHLTVVPRAELRRHEDATRPELFEALRLDQAVVGSVNRGAGLTVSLRLVDGSRTLRDTLITADDGEPLARRLGMWAQRGLAAHLDSLERRSWFRSEDAWRNAEAARAQWAVAERALIARAYAQASDEMDRSDSLLRAAAATEARNAVPWMLLALSRDRRAFIMEYLRQARPDTAAQLQDPMGIRRSALALLDTAVATDSAVAAVLQARGSLKLGLVRVGGPDSLLAGACRDLRRATDLDRRRAPAWAELAYCYEQEGAWDEALFAYERALDADPLEQHRATYLRGTFDAALLAGQPRRAAAACRDGLREYPGDERLWDCALKLLGRTGSTVSEAGHAAALADSLAVHDQNATSLAIWRLYAAQALARAGRDRDAERLARLAAAGLPRDATPAVVFIELARVRWLLRDRDSTVALLRRAVAGNANVRRYLVSDPAFSALRAELR